MAEIFNLKQTRKAKARTEKEKQADANRRKFGQTKDEKELVAKKADLAERRIEGHKRETDEDEF
jgi:hypothetical protein